MPRIVISHAQRVTPELARITLVMQIAERVLYISLGMMIATLFFSAALISSPVRPTPIVNAAGFSAFLTFMVVFLALTALLWCQNSRSKRGVVS